MNDRYEKVRFIDGEKVRAVFLRVKRDSGKVLVGTEVDKYGDDVEGPGFTERTRIIQKTLIKSRRHYAIDLKYAELVPIEKVSKL